MLRLNVDALLTDFDRLIRRDPAMRGLIARESEFGPLCVGHLAGAVKSLSGNQLSIGIATGFFIPDADPPAAETDGIPGAIRLAQALLALGHHVELFTDEYCLSALKSAAEIAELPGETVQIWNRNDSIDYTHVISIERPGPSHTLESVSQERDIRRTFQELVASESYNHHHNMRGHVLDPYVGDVSMLFEQAVDRADITSIGVGDGGNEVGMGAIDWQELARRIPGPTAALIPCRIPADWNIIAGTSNWGAYALAAGVLAMHQRLDVLEAWTCDAEEDFLSRIVERGPLVDGVTKAHRPTVDGLPFLTYIQPWAGIRHRLGLPE